MRELVSRAVAENYLKELTELNLRYNFSLLPVYEDGSIFRLGFINGTGDFILIEPVYAVKGQPDYEEGTFTNKYKILGKE